MDSLPFDRGFSPDKPHYDGTVVYNSASGLGWGLYFDLAV